jgi:hypothetical protein
MSLNFTSQQVSALIGGDNHHSRFRSMLRLAKPGNRVASGQAGVLKHPYSREAKAKKNQNSDYDEKPQGVLPVLPQPVGFWEQSPAFEPSPHLALSDYFGN